MGPVYVDTQFMDPCYFRMGYGLEGVLDACNFTGDVAEASGIQSGYLVCKPIASCLCRLNAARLFGAIEIKRREENGYLAKQIFGVLGE